MALSEEGLVQAWGMLPSKLVTHHCHNKEVFQIGFQIIVFHFSATNFYGFSCIALKKCWTMEALFLCGIEIGLRKEFNEKRKRN